ncbi:hypothetical protein K5X82_17140 [Halosquirtibacter xylanolyticus]|uniref:hypothetical protein n=1 Tax=Halosquirtibacter xylanolyticus TaxID=3374599 RepID=UPI0037493A79|nr:hypothetical protein K5X82_17140 [Prolixibacteraceae bacterium]
MKTKNIKHFTRTARHITDRIIHNSATGDKQDARNRNDQTNQSETTGFLDRNIHEIVILIILFTCLFGHKLDLPSPTLNKFTEYLAYVMCFLFGRQRK